MKVLLKTKLWAWYLRRGVILNVDTLVDLSVANKGHGPPIKLQVALYYLVFTIFHHIKNKIILISPLAVM
jgi:hypothetical protein